MPSSVDGSTVEQRLVDAVAALPRGGAIEGWGSLAWRGGRWFRGVAAQGDALPVPLAIGDNRRMAPRPGWRLSEEWLAPGDVTWVDGLPVTLATRAVLFEMRHARGLRQAVQVLDMAAFDDLVSIDEVAAYAGPHLIARRLTKHVGRAIELANENSWSPPEVTMRIAWQIDGRYPRPLCNVPIFDRAGNHLVTPDLFDPDNGVAGEYDGVIHLGRAVRNRDLDRESLYKDHGIEVVMMTSTDWADISRFLRRLDAAYARAARRAVMDSWTLVQPHWWVDVSTVERRRSLPADQRAIWLKRQIA